MIEDIRIREQEKQRTEYDFLQAQINPHFLNNTLLSVKSLIAMHQPERAYRMMNELVELLHIPATPEIQFVPLEEELHAAGSAVAGCGPAFAAIFLEAMADGGVACGLPRASAIQYAAQMMLGTAKMVLETNQHPGVLKDSVCSPAGSTIQGVRTLEERGMRAAVLDAVTVAYEKNVELKKASD